MRRLCAAMVVLAQGARFRRAPTDVYMQCFATGVASVQALPRCAQRFSCRHSHPRLSPSCSCNILTVRRAPPAPCKDRPLAGGKAVSSRSGACSCQTATQLALAPPLPIIQREREFRECTCTVCTVPNHARRNQVTECCAATNPRPCAPAHCLQAAGEVAGRPARPHPALPLCQCHSVTHRALFAIRRPATCLQGLIAAIRQQAEPRREPVTQGATPCTPLCRPPPGLLSAATGMLRPPIHAKQR